MRVLAAAASIGHACWENGHECIELPIADGGEGTLEVLGGPNRTNRVTNPLGKPVDAQWRLSRDLAVIEMARASGLSLVGGKLNNDVIAASTIGTGELIDTALNDGAKRIIVCVGGSATVDGGLGAIRAIKSAARLRGVEFLVACDVRAKFTDAARLFGAQKGATPAQIEFLTSRLHALVQTYKDEFGVDVSELEGAGAAGGLAGGLAALGAKLVPGFDIVADEVGVVGGVQQLAMKANKPVAVICGDAQPEQRSRIEAISLVESFGQEAAIEQTLTCIEKAARELLARR